jgi:hypothetical protein
MGSSLALVILYPCSNLIHRALRIYCPSHQFSTAPQSTRSPQQNSTIKSLSTNTICVPASGLGTQRHRVCAWQYGNLSYPHAAEEESPLCLKSRTYNCINSHQNFTQCRRDSLEDEAEAEAVGDSTMRRENRVAWPLLYPSLVPLETPVVQKLHTRAARMDIRLPLTQETLVRVLSGASSLN